jgi:hypothetical protein
MSEARTLDGRRAVAIPEALLAKALLKVFQLLKRKAFRKPWVSVQEGRPRRFGSALRDGVSYYRPNSEEKNVASVKA